MQQATSCMGKCVHTNTVVKTENKIALYPPGMDSTNMK